jgi:cation diffusion facilitator family transporter
MQRDASLERWRQGRARLPEQHGASERKARLVFVLTVATMVIELVTGWLTGSMALLADGWHMGSHAAALGIAAFAYAFARRHATSERFSFGTGKVGALAGFASALLLAVVALLMAVESVQRLILPVSVHFNEAIAVAVLGLAVNIASVLLLSGGAAHGHEHDVGEQDHDRHHHHHDHNLRAAYLHVLADALTSVLAILALAAGKWLGWVWMDPTVAIAASVLIGWWAWGLLKGTGQVLLDAADDGSLKSEIVKRIESDADNRVADLRLWRIGGEQRALILSVATHHPRSAEHYKQLLTGMPGLDHVTIEVFVCTDEPCATHGKP